MPTYHYLRWKQFMKVNSIGKMQDFKAQYGPWALVAGASEGLGAAFARSLAKRGLNLILLARRIQLLESLAQEIRQEFEIEINCIEIDLSNETEVNHLVEKLNEEIGLLVYNAAYSPIGYFANTDVKSIMKIVEVNVATPLMLTKLLSDGMIERNRGGIILMSSMAGAQGSPKIATYAASKSFNSVLAEGLWKELGQFNIHVLASIAGAIRTPGYATASEGKNAPGTLGAGQVAEETINALGKGPAIIPGFFNKFANFIMIRLLGRRQRINIMYSNTKDLS